MKNYKKEFENIMMGNFKKIQNHHFDTISLTPVYPGDYIQFDEGYYFVIKIIDRAENGYTLFRGIGLSKSEYRERMIEKILS